MEVHARVPISLALGIYESLLEVMAHFKHLNNEQLMPQRIFSYVTEPPSPTHAPST